jgi:hypothetical protein
MTKCSNINCEYHRSFYFQEGNAYAKNTLSLSKISNKISLSKLSKVSSNANLSGSVSYANRNVKAFLKSYVKNKYCIENRAKYFKYIYSKILKIKELSCLKKKYFYKKAKVYDGYTIDDIVNLEKQIGSDSKYGSIFITSIKDVIGKYPIATKLMKVNTSNSIEKYLNEHITKKILKLKLSKHFVFTYRTFLCNNISSDVPPIISNLNYYVNLNELAHGDLKQLCKLKTYVSDDMLVYNVFIQVMLSIMTFQCTGYTHGDCHYGNFLYQRNPEEGYYQYDINGTKYYLKSCKYNMIIFDFGFAKTIDRDNQVTSKMLEDYIRIIHAFANKKILPNSWSYFGKYPSDNVSYFTNYLLNKLITINKTLVLRRLKGNKKLKDLISEMIIPHLTKAPKNIFTKYKPIGKIINKKPFLINDSLHV